MYSFCTLKDHNTSPPRKKSPLKYKPENYLQFDLKNNLECLDTAS